MPGPVGRNKLAQFRHHDSAFAVRLPELRKLVPAYIFWLRADQRPICKRNVWTNVSKFTVFYDVAMNNNGISTFVFRQRVSFSKINESPQVPHIRTSFNAIVSTPRLGFNGDSLFGHVVGRPAEKI